MLDDKEVKKIDEAVRKLDISEIIDMAKEMGIQINSSNRGCHTIRNKNGEREILDMDKHFKIILEGDLDVDE